MAVTFDFPYSRLLEKEADQIGMKLAAKVYQHYITFIHSNHLLNVERFFNLGMLRCQMCHRFLD